MTDKADAPGPNAGDSTGSAKRLTVDELNARWNESPDAQKAAISRRRWTIASYIIGAVGVLIILATLTLVKFFEDYSWAGYLLGFYFLLCGALSFWVAKLGYETARKKFNEQEELVARAANFTRAVESLENKLSLEYVSGLNSLLMNSYHDVTKTQAERSFRHSQLAMGAGLFLIVSSGITLVAPTSPETKITVAGLAAVGTLVSGFITKTFLTSHAAAIAQLNRFFEQPLVNSYLLNAERLAGQMGDESRDKILILVIRESVSAARQILSEPARQRHPSARAKKEPPESGQPVRARPQRQGLHNRASRYASP